MSSDLITWIVLGLSVCGLAFCAGWILGGLHRDDKNLKLVANLTQTIRDHQAAIDQLRANEVSLMDQWINKP